MTDVITYEELDYTRDRRVQAQADGTVLVTAGVQQSLADRILFQDGDVWFARGIHSADDDVLWNEASGLMGFGSVEEAICHIIGAPSELEDLGGEHQMFLLMNEDGTAYADEGCPPETLLVQQRPGPPETSWCAFEAHTDEPVRFYGDTPEAAADAYFGIE